MSKLTARFEIPLAQPLFVFSDRRRKFAYKAKIDEFDVDICLTPEAWPTHDLEAGTRFCIFGISLEVSKELAEEIPDDLIKRSDHFQEHSGAYSKTACIVVNRIISFFKYKLHQPLLEEISEYKNFFLAPTWYDENDNKIEPGSFRFTVEDPAGLDSTDFGIVSLTVQDKEVLTRATEKEASVELYEEILADAQSAIFQGNRRRAILEMAMACELAIKQTYFSKSTAADRAYEYIEEKVRMMDITVYIDVIADYAFGETFSKASSKEDFINIKCLFRGRNKIAHRGELIFRDEKGKIHPIDRATLKRWWVSVERLLAWLNSKRSTQ
jgi:hypothetical protein